MQKIIKKQDGISLVALIITIIVMVILAGIIITAAVADGGIIDRAKISMREKEEAEIDEIIKASYVIKNFASTNILAYLDLEKTGIAIYENLTANGFTVLGAEETTDENGNPATTVPYDPDKKELSVKVEGDHGTYQGSITEEGKLESSMEPTSKDEGNNKENKEEKDEVSEPDLANPSGTIPTDATYKTADGKTLNSGDAFPTVSNGDTYTYGDYTYTYESEISPYFTDAAGWNVKANSKFQKEYGAILETIAGKPITGMSSCFYECKSMITPPVIPDTVYNMYFAFYKCEALTAMPKMPSHASELQMAFYGCKNLVTVTALPAGTERLYNAFYGCSSMIVAPDMSACVNLTTMEQAFQNCTSLTAAPDWSNSPNITSFEKAFRGCSKLQTVPATICAENVAYMFKGCTSLTGTITFNIPDLSTCTGIFENVYLKSQNVIVTGTVEGRTNLYSLTSTAVDRGNS